MRRFVRSRALVARSVMVGVISAALLAMYVVLASQSLTGPQLAERDLGEFDSMAGYGAISADPGADVVTRMSRRLSSLIGPKGQVAITAQDFPALVGSDAGVHYKEMDWEGEPFADRYDEIEGRLPTAANEVVLVDTGSDTRPKLGAAVPAFGGQAEFTVVGYADDNYSSSPALLAGPGTWAGLRPQVAKGYPALAAQPIVYWDGRHADVVLGAIAEIAAESDEDDGLDPAGQRELIDESLSTRAETLANQSRTWIEQSPAGYLIPSLLLPALMTLLVFGLALRRLSSTVQNMIGVGVKRRIARLGTGLAIGAQCLGAALIGALAGYVAGYGIARLGAEFSHEPVAGFPTIWPPLARVLLGVLIGCILGFLLVARAGDEQTDPRPQMLRKGRGRVRDLRHLAAVGIICVAIVQVNRLDSPAGAMLLSGTLASGAILMVPEMLAGALRIVPERRPVWRLGRRSLLADSKRATAAVASLSLMLGLSLGFLALLNSQIKAADAESQPTVYPGQVKIADRGTDTAPVPTGVLNAATDVASLGSQTPVQLRFLARSDNDVTRVVADGNDGNIIALDTVDDAARLLHEALDSPQRSTLENGGMLLWGSVAPQGSVALQVTEPARDLGQVKASAMDTPSVEWAYGVSGIMLTATAQELKAPIRAGAVMFTDVPPDDAKQVGAALRTGGIDPETAVIYQEPDPPIPPSALIATACGLVVLVLAISLMSSRAQVVALRGLAAQLLAIGLPLRFARTVMLVQQGIVLGLSALIGVAVGVTPVVLAVWRIAGLDLAIPWEQMALLLFAILGATLIGTLTATWRIRPNERVALS